MQDYALTAFSYEDVDTELMQSYEENKTKIIIQKQDSENEKTLQGAKFELLNQYKNTIMVNETDDNGQIIFEGIIPGIYYIRELEAPKGYELNSELLEVKIQMNETQIVKITNNIIEKEPLQVEEPPKTNELKLPVTGM